MAMLLVGLSFLVSGVVMWVFSPKKVNQYYGYRTRRAMKSQRLWNEAQRYSRKWLIGLGMVHTLIGLVLFRMEYPDEAYVLAEMVFVLGTIIPLFVLTERRLREID